MLLSEYITFKLDLQCTPAIQLACLYGTDIIRFSRDVLSSCLILRAAGTILPPHHAIGGSNVSYRWTASVTDQIHRVDYQSQAARCETWTISSLS